MNEVFRFASFLVNRKKCNIFPNLNENILQVKKNISLLLFCCIFNVSKVIILDIEEIIPKTVKS